MVDVDQFYGIELGEFPAHIAEVALWMMDHIMNNRLSLEFEARRTRAFRWRSRRISSTAMRWRRTGANLLPAAECSYVLGNPPFVGAKFQTSEQREQVRRIAALGKSGGTLDYVTAVVYQGRRIRAAERSTNRLLWRPIPSPKASRSRNSGRFLFSTAASWTLPLPTVLLLGARTLAAWHTFTSSLSD